MRGLRAKRVKTVKEGTLIATVDIGVAKNTGYCTTVNGRGTKSFRFDNTKEGTVGREFGRNLTLSDRSKRV